MKTIKTVSLILLMLMSLRLNAQAPQIENVQQGIAISVVTGTSPSDPGSYQWQEIANIKQGVHISVVPTKIASVYLELNNSWVDFNTWYWGFMIELKLSFDNGAYQTIFTNTTKDASGWLAVPFSTLGHHSISIYWRDINGTQYFRTYDAYVVPASQKFYRDNYGNTLTLWANDPGSGKPIIVSEGFDAYNNTYAEYLRYKGDALFSPLLAAGYRIYLLNYFLNTQDMRNSAAIYNSVARYISSITGNTSMVAAGISMGGVIVRYSLTKAENDGNHLPFAKFFSFDAPQEGAVVSYALQDFIKGATTCGSQDVPDFDKFALHNTAALQLLANNPYDHGTSSSSFYTELKGLNGGIGYPSLPQNIGVSFSNGTQC